MNGLTRGGIDVQVSYTSCFTGRVDQDEADDHLILEVGCGCDDCLSAAAVILSLVEFLCLIERTLLFWDIHLSPPSVFGTDCSEDTQYSWNSCRFLVRATLALVSQLSGRKGVKVRRAKCHTARTRHGMQLFYEMGEFSVVSQLVMGDLMAFMTKSTRFRCHRLLKLLGLSIDLGKALLPSLGLICLKRNEPSDSVAGRNRYYLNRYA